MHQALCMYYLTEHALHHEPQNPIRQCHIHDRAGRVSKTTGCEKLCYLESFPENGPPLWPEVLNHTAHWDGAGLIASLGAGLGMQHSARSLTL